MKKTIIIFFAIICSWVPITAEQISNSFKFDESEFKFVKMQGDSITIYSDIHQFTYGKIGSPAIPLVAKRIALTKGEQPIGVTYSYGKKLIKTNVNISSVQKPAPTNVSPSDVSIINSQYQDKIYPNSICEMTHIHNIGEAKLVDVFISPFIYDASTHELFIVDSICVNLQIEQGVKKHNPIELHPNEARILKSLSLNPDSLDVTEIPICIGSYDYLIITNEKLKAAYEPLAEWKRKKGVTTKIITTEEIDNYYPGATQPIKIKKLIKEFYDEHYTQFVLLGGDVDIVPTQYCRIKHWGLDRFERELDQTEIPSDVYYSCMYGPLDWDTNGDGIAGYYGDNIEIMPSMFVSRAPVRTVADVEAFVNRTIEYEQSPVFTRDLFQAGTKMNNKVDGLELADLLFNNIFVNKIPLGAVRLFKDHDELGTSLSLQSYCNAFSKGYQFAEVFSHGSGNSFNDGENFHFFTATAASSINNSGHTFLSTIACSTNSFDLQENDYKSNPCLSEALFRNPNSGVIGYIGSSRYGWFNPLAPMNTLSQEYENEIYRRLFDKESLLPPTKHLGAILCFAKASLSHSIYSKDDSLRNPDSYRWLHYSINALGDPETPIINSIVYSFNNAFAEYNSDGMLRVYTGFDDAKVCVSNVKTKDGYYSRNQGKDLTFDTGYGTFDVWITRQNYRPMHFEVKRLREIINPGDSLSIESENEIEHTRIISISPSPATTTVEVKYATEASDSNLQILFTNVSSGRQYTYDITQCLGHATIDISGLINGIYAVSLIENGVLITSNEKLIKQ